MRGQVRDLTDITEEELALLERTPGSAIGTSRDALEEPEYRLLAEKCVEFGAKYVLMNGGTARWMRAANSARCWRARVSA